jgi:hypothetical protein
MQSHHPHNPVSARYRTAQRRAPVTLLLATLSIITLGACSRRALSKDIPSSAPLNTSTVHSITTTPLTVRVEHPAELAQIGALLILPPTIPTGHPAQTRLKTEVATLLEQAAARELSLPNFSATPWRAATPTRGTALDTYLRTGSTRELQALGIDTLLRTELTAFIERSGSRVGGEPATVSFIMTALRAADGHAVWQAKFSYSQRALSDNILQLGDRIGERSRGTGWTSGGQILDAGVVSALRDLNLRREQQFLAKKD